MRQTRQQSCRAQKAATKASASNAAPLPASIAAPEMAPAVGDPALAGAFSVPTQQPTPSPGAEAAPPTSKLSQAPRPPKRMKGEVSSEALHSNIKLEVSPELAHKLGAHQGSTAVPVAAETGSVPPGSSDGQCGEQQHPPAAEDSHNAGALVAEGLDASSGAPPCRSATPASVLDPATAGPPLSAAQVMAGADGPGPVPEAGVLPFKPLPRQRARKRRSPPPAADSAAELLRAEMQEAKLAAVLEEQRMREMQARHHVPSTRNRPAAGDAPPGAAPAGASAAPGAAPAAKQGRAPAAKAGQALAVEAEQAPPPKGGPAQGRSTGAQGAPRPPDAACTSQQPAAPSAAPGLAEAPAVRQRARKRKAPPAAAEGAREASEPPASSATGMAGAGGSAASTSLPGGQHQPASEGSEDETAAGGASAARRDADAAGEHPAEKAEAGAKPAPVYARTGMKGRPIRLPSGRLKRKSPYDDVVGKMVDIPGVVFGVPLPDVFYTGQVMKRDHSHAGCVVIRFPDDGSRYYLPATDIRQFLADMEAREEGVPLQRVGAAEEANDAAAIEVLAQALTRKNQAATGHHRKAKAKDIKHRPRKVVAGWQEQQQRAQPAAAQPTVQPACDGDKQQPASGAAPAASRAPAKVTRQSSRQQPFGSAAGGSCPAPEPRAKQGGKRKAEAAPAAGRAPDLAADEAAEAADGLLERHRTPSFERLEGLASMADTRAAAESRLRVNAKKVKREAPPPNTRVN